MLFGMTLASLAMPPPRARNPKLSRFGQEQQASRIKRARARGRLTRDCGDLTDGHGRRAPSPRRRRGGPASGRSPRRQRRPRREEARPTRRSVRGRTGRHSGTGKRNNAAGRELHRGASRVPPVWPPGEGSPTHSQHSGSLPAPDWPSLAQGESDGGRMNCHSMRLQTPLALSWRPFCLNLVRVRSSSAGPNLCPNRRRSSNFAAGVAKGSGDQDKLRHYHEVIPHSHTDPRTPSANHRPSGRQARAAGQEKHSRPGGAVRVPVRIPLSWEQQ